jgi:DNA polymerase
MTTTTSTDAAVDEQRMSQREALAAIAKRVASCTACGLCKGRTNAVPGEGNPAAEIVFIGEGPGFYEDQQGRPFVGASGKFLDELLAGIGLDRKKVFIANVVKCRPPQNRDPQPDEIAACGEHLDAQLRAIDPKVVVTLGRHSMQRYFPGEAISRVHGQPRKKGDLIVVPMYHPAAALHQASLRRVIEADFARLPGFLAKAIGGDTVADAIPPHLQKNAPAVVADAKAGEDTNAQPAEPEAQQMRLL